MGKTCVAIFGVVTLVVLSAGTFSPGWLVSSREETVHFGLFYVLIVFEESHYTFGYGSGNYLLGFSIVEFQVETILVIFLSIISVVLTFLYNRKKSPKMLLASAILYLISGILTFVAIGHWSGHLIEKIIESDGVFTVSYSLIINGLGGIFLFILSIVLFLMFCKLRKNPNGGQGPKEGVIFNIPTIVSNDPIIGSPASGEPPPPYEDKSKADNEGQAREGIIYSYAPIRSYSASRHPLPSHDKITHKGCDFVHTNNRYMTYEDQPQGYNAQHGCRYKQYKELPPNPKTVHKVYCVYRVQYRPAYSPKR